MKTRGWLVGSVVLVLAGCAAPWQEYRSTEGGFTVLLPGTPKVQSHEEKTSRGPITVNAAVVVRSEAAFVAAWADLPPEIPFDLDERLKAIADRYQGEIVKKREIEIEGRPGLEFVLETRKPHGQAVGRIVQIHNRLYRLLVVGSRVEGSSEVEGFFRSFKLVNPEMKPQTTARD
jgi:hypothetical protein